MDFTFSMESRQHECPSEKYQVHLKVIIRHVDTQQHPAGQNADYVIGEVRLI